MSGGTPLAPLTDAIKDQALPPKDIVAAQEASIGSADEEDAEEPAETNGGVGHAMVEGAAETAEEIHERIEEQVKKAKEDVSQPAVLDDEVAEIITREEIKEQLPPTPSPPRAISPAPPSGRPSREATPTRRDEAMSVGVGEEEEEEEVEEVEEKGPAVVQTPPLPTASLPADTSDHISKRPREDDDVSVPGPSKRSRPGKIYDKPLPSSLSHLLHPPTSTLYITNLRRPLLLSTLHDYIDPSSPSHDGILPPPRGPFASEDTPGLWLSGIKDHAYATYPSIDEALEVAERIENVTWPEDTGSALHVEFIPDERVLDLVQKEEIAWANGRQKLSLRIEKLDGGEWDYRLEGASSVTTANGRRGPIAQPLGARIPSGPAGFNDRSRGPALSGANAIGGRPPSNAPSGPAGLRSRPGGFESDRLPVRNGDMGRFGRDQPPLDPGRFGRDGPSRGGFGGRPDVGRFGMANKVTRTRPGLAWREGPGAHAR